MQLVVLLHAVDGDRRTARWDGRLATRSWWARNMACRSSTIERRASRQRYFADWAHMTDAGCILQAERMKEEASGVLPKSWRTGKLPERWTILKSGTKGPKTGEGHETSLRFKRAVLTRRGPGAPGVIPRSSPYRIPASLQFEVRIDGRTLVGVRHRPSVAYPARHPRQLRDVDPFRIVVRRVVIGVQERREEQRRRRCHARGDRSGSTFAMLRVIRIIDRELRHGGVRRERDDELRRLRCGVVAPAAPQFSDRCDPSCRR